jgi:hypothetical protein
MSNEPPQISQPSAFDSDAVLPDKTLLVLPLCTAALFLSALILFTIQPMFTKMILPLMGGTPAVWNTAVMFFQAMLLAGYLYAHLLSRWRGVRKQARVHIAVLAVGFLFLPIHAALQWTPAVNANPVPWLVALLTVSIGVPFFAISATAPLLQGWFSHSGHPHARDPYFLYVSSNIGGLLALLAYPVAIEPLIGLTWQSRAWTIGYGLLALTVVLYSLSLRVAQRRSGARADTVTASETPDLAALLDTGPHLSESVGWANRARWVALSFVPSALLLAVTLHISTDIASVPFLWVIPLSLYLLSFILVFARRPILRHRWMLHLQVWVYILLAIYFTEQDLHLLALHLLALFVTAMVCHGELVRRRPAAEHLTEFYLWMSVGGLLGGVFCALIAPAVFNSVLEYPLILILACLLRPTAGGTGYRRYLFDVALPALLALLYFLTPPLLERLRLDLHAFGITGPLLFYGAVAILFFTFRRRALRLTLAFAPLLIGSVLQDEMAHQIFRQRSFFGVYTVSTDASGKCHHLYHGTTLHGEQFQDADRLRTPTSYYNREGPLGQVFDAVWANRRTENGGQTTEVAETQDLASLPSLPPTASGPKMQHIGVVGLGTGATACYQSLAPGAADGQPGQTMTFFEIDPVIERIARDPSLFRYLELCGRDTQVIIGDGRQSLSRMPDGTFDLLVVDAFSSDAIPIHLLTREALGLYMRKLAPGGITMLHISNRYLRLEPVVANLAVDTGLSALIEEYDPSDDNAPPGAAASTWVALARDPDDLVLLEVNERWRPLQEEPAVGVWTDDYSNIFRILIWGKLFGGH